MSSSLVNKAEEVIAKVRDLEVLSADYLKRIEKEAASIQEAENKIQTLEEAYLLAKNCSKSFLDKLSYIEEIMTNALRMVFNKEYTFYYERVLDKAGGLKGLLPVVVSEQGVAEHPATSFGTSVCQIISIIHQICVLILSNGTKPVLMGDELFTGINYTLRAPLEDFIEKVCDEGGVQLITVSHLNIKSGTVYYVEMVDGVTKVEKASN